MFAVLRLAWVRQDVADVRLAAAESAQALRQHPHHALRDYRFVRRVVCDGSLEERTKEKKWEEHLSILTVWAFEHLDDLGI